MQHGFLCRVLPATVYAVGKRFWIVVSQPKDEVKAEWNTICGCEVSSACFGLHWVRWPSFLCLLRHHLTTYRYQSKFAVLQAAQYGAPQGRKRVIFWAARRDVLMPEWPIPTHCSPIKLIRPRLSTGSFLPAVIRNKCEGGLDDDRSAPLHFVTIDEAIGDLVCVHW